MTQTLDNGITVPINSDAYQLTADLATMGNSTNAPTICANAAAQNALTTYPGRLAYRLDTGALMAYNGSAWAPITPGIGTSYAFLGSTNFTVQGEAMVTNMSNGRKKVDIDLVVTRANSTFTVSTSNQTLGTILPPAAVGTGNTKCINSHLYNANGTVFLDVRPSTGEVFVSSTGALSWPVGAFATANCTYYI